MPSSKSRARCDAQVGRPASFAVELGKARGPLDARVVAPSGAEDTAVVEQIDQGTAMRPYAKSLCPLSHVLLVILISLVVRISVK